MDAILIADNKQLEEERSILYTILSKCAAYISLPHVQAIDNVRATTVLSKYPSSIYFLEDVRQRIHYALECISNHSLLLTEIKKVSFGSTARVYTTTIYNNPMFVIKNSVCSLYHEFFVGMMCINNLRRIVCNFPYTFTHFISWIDTNTLCGEYLIQERIDGMSLHDSINKITLQQYQSYILQVIYALKIAYTIYSFTHYDLNLRNVILRDVPTVPLTLTYLDKYVVTDKKAIIIDYGTSYIYLRDVDYGVRRLTHYSIYHNRPSPLHDIFRLIALSIYHCDTILGPQLHPLLSIYLDSSVVNIPKYLEDVKDTLHYPLSNIRDGLPTGIALFDYTLDAIYKLK